MRKTFKELVEELGTINEFVDAYFQDDYKVVNSYIIKLLELVRQETLEEYSNSLDPYHFISNDIADYSKIELRDGFPKDSIKVDDPNKEYCCCQYP